MLQSKYNTIIIPEMTFGKYIWCRNMNANSGFKLTNQNIDDISYVHDTFMINLKIKMNCQLAIDTHYIEIYDHKGGLFNYNVKPINSMFYTTTIQIKDNEIGTQLTIKFCKPKVLSEQEEENLFKTLKRRPMDVIHKHIITIPNLTTFDDLTSKTECLLCLSNVTERTNKFITSCGHTYHMNCIWDYLVKNNCIGEIHSNCKHSCCNTGSIIKSFSCPFCNVFQGNVFQDNVV